MPCDPDSNKPEPTPVRQQAAAWFVRRRDTPPSDEEQRAFERWLTADPRNRVEYEATRHLWQELEGLRDAVSAGETGDCATRYISDGSRAWRRMAVAATLVLSLLAGLFVLRYDPNVYRTAKGEQRTLPLADGSVVRLNSDTLLRVAMSDVERTLYLQRGEAFFEVAHDPARPFIVVAGGGTARAVGTEFNVYRYASGVRVTVTEGRVEVAVESGSRRLLEPNETVTYQLDGRQITPVERLDNPLPEWLEGRIRFEAASLAEVVAEFNRYREPPLRIADPRLNDLTLSGTFRITDLGTFPELLPRMLPVTLEQTGDGTLLFHSD